MLIAIEGIDGSGKGTQAARLAERFHAQGRRCSLISFPRYGQTRFGRAVGDFLNGRFGALDQVNPFLASLLYAGDRFESRAFLQDQIARHDVVVLDRYVASNMAHQGAKLDGRDRTELIDWVRQVEFQVYQLPQPDLTILLDIPAGQAQQLIAKKSPRNYTDKPADIQEADREYLENVRNVYLQLSQSGQNLQTINCQDGNVVRSVEDIGNEIWSVAEDHAARFFAG